MNDIRSIIDFNKHPIDDFSYIKTCTSLITNNSLLLLENFLSNKSLEVILADAKSLEDRAFYCEQKHTVLLNKQ